MDRDSGNLAFCLISSVAGVMDYGCGSKRLISVI
jgi:hypothetical protein